MIGLTNQYLYEFLSSYGLTTPQRVVKIVKNLTLDEVGRFLEKYREIQGDQTLVPRKGPGFINAFNDSWVSALPSKTIKQLCLFTDTIYLKDPLVEEYYLFKSMNINPAYVLSYPNQESRTDVVRNSLINSLQMLLRLRPLVEMGIVVVLPMQLLAGRKEPGAMYSDSFYGPKKEHLPSFEANPFPTHVQMYLESHLMIHPVKYENNSLAIHIDEKLAPTRMISVGFPDDCPKIFHLFDIQKMDEKTKSFGMYLDIYGKGKPVDIDTFNNWVEGSCNQYVSERLKVLQTDAQLASETNSRLLTPSKTSKDLLNLICSAGVETDELINYIDINLPYFESVTEKSLAKARKNEAAFEEFRNAFSKALTDIDSEVGISQKKIDQVIGDIIRSPVAKVEARMKALRRNLFLDAVMFIGTLTTSIIAKEPIAAGAALLLAGKAVSDYKGNKSEEDKIKESPGYFYWKAANRR